MKRVLSLLSAFALALPLLSQTPLYEGFANPPQEARPRVWWHWMDGNISLDGIRKDIEWMERVGIGGFHQFDAGGIGMKKIVDEPRTYGTPQWKEAFSYAMSLAREKGMETAVASAPGWSSTGGLWVSPEDAMKKLTWRTLEVSGPSRLNEEMPPLYSEVGRYQNIPEVKEVAPWSQYVATVAVRLPEDEKTMEEMGAKVSSSSGDFSVRQLSNGDFSDGSALDAGDGGSIWIGYSFDSPVTVKAITIGGNKTRTIWYCKPPDYVNSLECSDDGKTWKKVCDIPSSILPVHTMSVPAATARHFRMVLAAKAVISEFVLHNVVKVNGSQDKAGFAAPFDLTTYLTPESSGAAAETVDLTPFEKDGVLSWDVPEGRWRIYRFGASLTGKKNHPAPPEATGLEVDKLSPEAWERYFSSFLKTFSGVPVDYLLVDSYEAGQMTWTKNMPQEFRSRRGYCLLPWLPALAGEIIGSTDRTERFLFDWRMTIGELFAENYARLGEIAKSAGMKGRFIESHENGHVFVGDGMDLKRYADIPMAAIWVENTLSGSPIPMARADIRESASVAHIYGQNIVAAESFTVSGAGGRTYTYCPDNLKYTADVALSSGLNRFVIHESSHQPTDTHRPGLDLLGYGQWFNRHETWAEEAKVWTDYLARSSYLLQKGRFKADILFCYGEDNSITGLYGKKLPDIPAGYAWDFIHPAGLMEAVSPSEGALVTDSGMRYRLLVLGENCKTMSEPLLRRILSLAKAGVPVCGTLPSRPASLGDDPEAFRSLSEELAGLMLGGSIDTALALKGIEPDFKGPEGFAFVHRETEEEDIWWVRNFSGSKVDALLMVGGGDGQAMVLDPADGSIRTVGSVAVKGGRRILNLPFEENDAFFIVIGKRAGEKLPIYKSLKKPVATLEGPWTLSFVSGFGAPSETVFDALKSYTESSDPTVKYYSGTVIYRKNFTLKRKQLKGAARFELGLGKVGNLARVVVNGHDIGVAWKAPFCLDIPAEYLHPGVNELEIKVINLWANRLIGDLRGEAPGRMTYAASNFFTPESPLLPSGLLGPVTISSVKDTPVQIHLK